MILRLARAFRGRDKILKFEGGYHGMHDYALMSNQWTMGEAPYPRAVPNSHGIPRSVQAEVLVAPFNDLETTAAIIAKYEPDYDSDYGWAGRRSKSVNQILYTPSSVLL